MRLATQKKKEIYGNDELTAALLRYTLHVLNL